MNYFTQESERLRFRKLTLEDISSWLDFFKNNDRLDYMGMDPSKSSETLASEWIHAQILRYENQGWGSLVVERKSDGEFIGLGGILPRVLDGKEEYEISYSLKPNYWGFGYATEIAKKMIDFGMKNIDTERFISIIHIDNMDSAKVARKNGLRILFKTEFMGMPVNVYGIIKMKEPIKKG